MPNNRSEYFKQYGQKNKEKLREYKTDWERDHNRATVILPKVKIISKELSSLLRGIKIKKDDKIQNQ